MEGTSEKVLLHSCCAPCSAAILEWMGQNSYEPTILFYNPNIFPEEGGGIPQAENRDSTVCA